MRRRLLLAATLAVAALAAPATAQAAIAWGGCPDASGGFAAFECARVPVPLDHSGALGGGLELFTRRLVAPSNPSRTAVVALAGGPGQAAAPIARDFAVTLAPALRTRDLIVFDQRGTGRSGELGCEALRDRGTLPGVVNRCALEIGPSRGLYRTVDSVADLELLRREAGYEKLTLYGVSYGTKVAEAYAARHPGRVERLLLDSVVPPEGPDALQRSSLRSAGRVLRSLCAGSLCSSATPDPVADLRRLLRRGTIRGRYNTNAGSPRRAKLSATSLFDIIVAGDVNPAWRAQLPAAMRAAVRGDEAPLLRLGASALSSRGGSVVASRAPTASPSRALYIATVCEEVAFPWARSSDVQTRVREAVEAVNATPASQFSPFDRRTAAGALMPLCLGWPNAAPAPAPEPPLPRVPALVLTGMADVRTPAEDARDVAGRIGASTVAVPYVGHSVLGSDATGCAQGAVAAFFGDRAVPACEEGRPQLAPASRPPARLRALRPARGLPGRAGRTLGAVVLTRYDALVQSLGSALDDGPRRVGGLRGGTVTRTSSGVRLRKVVFVRGVSVSGTVPSDGTTRLRIRGRAAARGVLRISETGRIRGRLGGRRVRLSSARPASVSDFPTLEELDRLPHQRRIG